MKNVQLPFPPPVVHDGEGWSRFEDKLSDEPETEFCPSVPLFPNLWFRSFSFSRAADAVHRYCRVVQAIFARPPTTPPISLVTHLHREIDQNPPPSVFPGGHPGNLAYPVLHRKRAIPSSAGRRPLLRFSPPREAARGRRDDEEEEEEERKKKEGKGREGKRRERREKEEERGKKGWKGKQNERWGRMDEGVGRWR